MFTENKPTRIPWLALCAITFVIAFWGFMTPLFEFPDEQVHLSTVTYVSDHAIVPPKGVLDLTNEMYRTEELLGTLRNDQGNNKYTYHPEYHVPYTNTMIGQYENEIKSLNTNSDRHTYVKEEGARYPIAYYAYSSFWLKLVNNADFIMRLYVARLGSLPLAFFMAYFVYKIGLLIFGKRKTAITLVILTMLQPMYSFVTAGINSDNLHNLLFFMVIYYSLIVIKRGLSWLPVSALFIVSGLDIATKPQGFITIPLITIALGMSMIRRRQWKAVGLGCLLALVLVSLSSRIWLGYVNFSNPRGASPSAFLQFSINKLVSQNIVWYWGVFKWLGVVLPPIYWRVANRVVLASGLGLVFYGLRIWRKKKVVADPYAILFILVASLVYAFAIYWADWQYHKNEGYSLGIQARYFFPTLVAHMSLLLTGILSFGWNRISRLWLRISLVGLFLWLQIGGLWRLITSYYTVSSFGQFVIQVSQYKPFYVKGNWWYLWITLYLLSLTYLLGYVLIRRQVDATRRERLVK